MVVASLLFFVIAAFYSISELGERIFRYSDESSRVISATRVAANRLVKEIREARLPEGSASTIVSTDTNEIIFHSDVDHDDTIEQVHYYLDVSDQNNQKLHRRVIKPVAGQPTNFDISEGATFTDEIIADHIINAPSQPIFSYFNGKHPMTTADSLYLIRLVRIVIYADYNPDREPPPFKLETDAQLRNPKLEG